MEPKKNKTGDYRQAIVHVLSLLRGRQTPPKILHLVETAVDLSCLLYQEEAKISPKAVLRLYNTAWLHYELCTEFFATTKSITHRKFFGIYLHALVLHAPPQYEILNLKAANTEHEERFFGQAKNVQIASDNLTMSLPTSYDSRQNK